MLRHCITALLIAPLLAIPARGENIVLSVHADTAAGPLPTFFEPSAFFGWTSNQMKQDFAVDAVRSSGLVVESTQLLLGPSTSLADYQARLAQSGLATVAALAAQSGAQFLLQVHGMPRWISKSSVTSTPPGCEEEWPTYQTVAPDPAKWAQWEAAIAATVTYFNVTHGLDNVWYQFWEEPDAPCFWTDTQANFLETWRHFVVGARSVDPAARVGGPEPAGGPDSIKPGESVPVMQAFIEFSAANAIQPGFISYHLFGSAPEQNRRANRQVLDLLSAHGFPPLPIVVGSWNPLSACYEPNEQRDDPSWPSPPSALGCWQTDNEMGASYSLAFMSHLAEGAVSGYQAMYQLDDADWGGSEEFPHDWGLRTNKNKHGLRKAIYHAQTIAGRLPRSLVSVSATHATPADEYFPHVYALAGADGDRLSVLLWSFVTSPGRQVPEVLRDLGYGPADFTRWGGPTRIAAYLSGALAVSALTAVPSEQAHLERMKAVFQRQRALVTETNRVSLAIDGFPSTGGYRLQRTLIDATHNNTYGTYVASGLNAAIATERLQALDTHLLAGLAQIPDVDLAPYAVMLLEIERLAGTGGCSSPATVGDARLTLSKLHAPAGDDQLKLRGSVALPMSPPLDPVAQGVRFVLTSNAGVVLADLAAAAGANWSANGAGTRWKYRDSSAVSGIVKATVRAKPDGTLRVQVTARGLALGAAPAGAPPRASIAFGVPTAAPGQCGATAFAACRTTANGATMRCP
ncbi:MAG: GH39 family glycosyl hydrolase [Candidatus Binatia bacterium]